jgi:hypothetical protein
MYAHKNSEIKQETRHDKAPFLLLLYEAVPNISC